MKKFKLQSVKYNQLTLQKDEKTDSKVKRDSKKSVPTEEQKQKQTKKLQIQKQIQMLNQKIGEASSNIQQTAKLLDIDLFLKKQKQKRLQYASKLNEQYEHQKKQREEKLYKTSSKGLPAQKLTNTLIKSQIPLTIFRAIDQIRLSDSQLRTWILDDHYHKLDEMLLDKTKNDVFGGQMKIEEEKCLKDVQTNSWKRARQVSSNSAQITFFPIKVQESQLQPSDFGEALISVLTLVPEQLSQVLYTEANDINKEKFFLLRFYPGGERKCILTDTFIEVRQYTHKSINVNSRIKNNLTFWSSIVEKGFKKLFYHLKQPKGLLQTLHTVFGVDPEILPFNNINTIKENFPKIVDSLLKFQPKALIGFVNDKSPTPFRIYPLKTVQFPADNTGKKKKKESNLPASTQILYHVSNPYSGNLLSSNFVNKFTLNEMFQKFNKIVILRELPARWSGVKIAVQFMSNGAPSFTGSQWTKNNQYSFTLTKATNTRIALRQKWGSYCEKVKEKEKTEQDIFGYLLFRSQQGQTEISCMKLEGLVHKCKNTDENGCIYHGYLEKGTYIVIPFSHLVSQQYMQLFNLDILVERQDLITINKSKINQYYYQNSQVSGEAILQKLQAKVKYEKPKFEKIMLPKLFYKADKTINLAYIENLSLTLMNNVTNEDYFVPGKMKNLLVAGEVKEEKKVKVNLKSAQNQEIENYEKEQALRVLLGYDVLMDEDINYGHMKEIIDQTSDIVDLANFGLGQEGLSAIMQTLMAIPRILRLDLSNNDLNDSAITYLCYFLAKGGRNQLRELNLSGNDVGKIGLKALKGLNNDFKELTILGVKL